MTKPSRYIKQQKRFLFYQKQLKEEQVGKTEINGWHF